MKTYGKAPESLSSITNTMLNDLIEFPAEKILKAFKAHALRSDEFPTTSDIAGLIKRNGKPPLSKERYIAISKKDGADRTRDDWQYLRDYEADQDGGWEDEPDLQKQDATQAENIRLREEIRAMKQETQRLSDLLHTERMRTTHVKPKPSMVDQIQRTVDTMRREGAREEDIVAFQAMYSMEPAHA